MTKPRDSQQQQKREPAELWTSGRQQGRIEGKQKAR